MKMDQVFENKTESTHAGNFVVHIILKALSDVPIQRPNAQIWIFLSGCFCIYYSLAATQHDQSQNINTV